MFLVSAVSPSLSAAIAAAVLVALARSGMKHETLATLMRISAPRLSQLLRGTEEWPLVRLLLVSADPDGRVFWKALLPELGELVGCEDTDAIAARLRDVRGLFIKRMAKASETPQRERQSA